MNIYERINEKYESLTKKQKQVADGMVRLADEMVYITLKELSKDLGITEMTILNTCQALGFEGFTDVKYEFRKEMIQSYKTDIFEVRGAYVDEVPSYELGDKERVLFDIGKEEMQNLAVFWNKIDFGEYFRAAEVIRKSRKIYVIGRGVSFIVAQLVCNRLSSCDIFAACVNAELNDDAYALMSSLDKETTLIAVSLPDYYFMTDKLAAHAKSKKAKVIAISDSQKAEIAGHSDYLLTAPTITRLFLNSLLGMVFVVDLLTSALKLIAADYRKI